MLMFILCTRNVSSQQTLPSLICFGANLILCYYYFSVATMRICCYIAYDYHILYVLLSGIIGILWPLEFLLFFWLNQRALSFALH